MKKILFAAALFTASLAMADAPLTGSAQIRFFSNGVFGLAYDAQGEGRDTTTITGEFWQNGTRTARLNRTTDGSWAGQLGRYYVTVYPAQLETKNNKNSLKIKIISNPGGEFDYTITTDKKGNMEINGFVGSGRLAVASFSKNGKEFSVQGTSLQFGVKENSKKPGHYDGTYLPESGGFGDSVTLQAGGTLYLPELFNSNPALFVALYVLPFHEAVWPGAL